MSLNSSPSSPFRFKAGLRMLWDVAVVVGLFVKAFWQAWLKPPSQGSWLEQYLSLAYMSLRLWSIDKQARALRAQADANWQEERSDSNGESLFEQPSLPLGEIESAQASQTPFKPQKAPPKPLPIERIDEYQLWLEWQADRLAPTLPMMGATPASGRFARVGSALIEALANIAAPSGLMLLIVGMLVVGIALIGGAGMLLLQQKNRSSPVAQLPLAQSPATQPAMTPSYHQVQKAPPPILPAPIANPSTIDLPASQPSVLAHLSFPSVDYSSGSVLSSKFSTSDLLDETWVVQKIVVSPSHYQEQMENSALFSLLIGEEMNKEKSTRFETEQNLHNALSGEPWQVQLDDRGRAEGLLHWKVMPNETSKQSFPLRAPVKIYFIYGLAREYKQSLQALPKMRYALGKNIPTAALLEMQQEAQDYFRHQGVAARVSVSMQDFDQGIVAIRAVPRHSEGAPPLARITPKPAPQNLNSQQLSGEPASKTVIIPLTNRAAAAASPSVSAHLINRMISKKPLSINALPSPPANALPRPEEPTHDQIILHRPRYLDFLPDTPVKSPPTLLTPSAVPLDLSNPMEVFRPPVRINNPPDATSPGR
jgi:hypothetical protein